MCCDLYVCTIFAISRYSSRVLRTKARLASGGSRFDASARLSRNRLADSLLSSAARARSSNLREANDLGPSVSCFAYTRIILWKTRIEKREAMRRETVRQLSPEITWLYLDGPPCKIQPNHASPRPIRVLMKTARADSLRDKGPHLCITSLCVDLFVIRLVTKSMRHNRAQTSTGFI